MIFVDTSAVIALVDKSDRHHAEAREIAAALPPRTRLVTTDLVLAEAATWFRRAQGAEVAFQVGRRLLDARLYEMVESTREREEEALELMRHFGDKQLSFADCLSFAVMREMGIGEAFTFDEDFVRCGFSRLRA